LPDVIPAKSRMFTFFAHTKYTSNMCEINNETLCVV
jgi:hypothetical protein